jgi:hypothetical protein
MSKASALFNGSSEQTLINRVTPTTEQREFLLGIFYLVMKGRFESEVTKLSVGFNEDLFQTLHF